MAYFDYNATSPLNPAARRTLLEASQSLWQNPSSPYQCAARVHNALEDARKSLADRLGKSTEEIVFTGGATEANNAVIRYLAKQLPSGKLVALSPFEHPSVYEAAKRFVSDRLMLLEADQEGAINLDHLQTVLEKGAVAAVSIMAVNNETGVIQPWQEVAKRCHAAGVLYHCDASQWFGKCADGNFAFCDFLLGCAHKFGGPKGVGYLALSKNTSSLVSQVGGGQESGKRGGTENVPSILAMLAALEYSESHLHDMSAQEAWRDQFEEKLRSVIPGLSCIGSSAPRVPNTSFLVLPEFENMRWVRKLDLKGFQLSTGSACSTGHTSVSSVLEALGYSGESGRKTLRVSAGPSTTESDWKELAKAFKEVLEDLRQSDSSTGTEVISI